MLIDKRVNRIAERLEAGGPPNEEIRAILRLELQEAIETERKRLRLAQVVAMSEEDAVRYRVISELASDWVYALRIDEHGQLMLEWATSAFEMVTGFTAEQVNEGGGFGKLLEPEDRVRLLSDGRHNSWSAPTTLEYRIITKSGEQRWLRDYASPELDRSGERVVRIYGAVKDVTSEIHAHEALHEAKVRLEQQVGFETARFRSVLDQAGEAIFMIEPETGRFIDVNETASTMLGFSQEQLLEMSTREVGLDTSCWRDPSRFQELRGRGVFTEGLYRRKDGSTFPVEAVISLRRYVGQDYLLAIVRDMTERKQLEIQLAQADRLASVGVLAAGVAHEINNPLVYILNNISYVLTALPEEQHPELKEALREARSGAHRVRDIVKDLKTFSRTDEKMGPVDVRRLLDSSVRVAHNEIRFRARVEVRYQPEVPRVRANERLGQVFLNLLLNAAHAIEEGHPQRNLITVTVKTQDSRVGISVRDTGSGIDPRRVTKIFDPFFTTKPIGMGTGLGLSICQNIVKEINGEIVVESTLGEGSEFTVWLPALRGSLVSVKAPSSIPPPVSPASLRVLVVDDDAFVARAIRRLLRSGHQVTLASGGCSALELMLRHDFDVIFCDVMMPTMTGLELHAEIRKLKPELAERFVFITGGAFTPQAAESLDSITNPCIQKPFTPADLRDAMDQASNRRQLPLSTLAANLG